MLSSVCLICFGLLFIIQEYLVLANQEHGHLRSYHAHDLALAEKAMIWNGRGYFKKETMSQRGIEMTDIRSNPEQMKLLFDSLYPRQFKSRNSDAETYDLLTGFYWGKTNGIVIELGAIDGQYLSQSKLLINKYQWHRILIEANPMYVSKLVEYSRDALSYNAAVCSKSQTIHYVNNKMFSGIYEFFPEQFKQDFHAQLFNSTTHEPINNIETLENVVKVPCVPMRSILKHANTSYVNVMILDTEGSELDILKSISWSEVMFEVIVIETEAKYRPLGYALKVRLYLFEKGYVLYMNKGRNSWFIRHDFKPSSKPLIQPLNQPLIKPSINPNIQTNNQTNQL